MSFNAILGCYIFGKKTLDLMRLPSLIIDQHKRLVFTFTHLLTRGITCVSNMIKMQNWFSLLRGNQNAMNVIASDGN